MTYKHFVENDGFPIHDGPSKVSKKGRRTSTSWETMLFRVTTVLRKYPKRDDVQALRGKWWLSESRRSFKSIKKGTTYKHFVENDGFPSHDGPSKVPKRGRRTSTSWKMMVSRVTAVLQKYPKRDDVQALRGKPWFPESRRSFTSIKKGTAYKHFVENDGFPSHGGPSKVSKKGPRRFGSL